MPLPLPPLGGVAMGLGVLGVVLPVLPPDDDLHGAEFLAECAVAFCGGAPFCPLTGVFSRCRK